ncbi:hypothetical protein FQN49_002491 [Arthroderma sp. PD_2]|nr:hypothetical protein FQN49_002491 [Arthroderma sp. PD_2]
MFRRQTLKEMASTKKAKAAKENKSSTAAATDGDSKPGKTLSRPPTRTIVRWNDDLDRKLLLAIQSACNRLGVRVPWNEVATMMKNGITEGAIVQHLAKLRTRMVNAGLEVPPPLRRGGTSEPSKLSAAPATPAATVATVATVAPTTTSSGKGNARKKPVKRPSYDSGDESFDEGKKPNKKAKASKGKANASKVKRQPKRTIIKSEDETEDSGVDGFELVSDTESINEDADAEYVATGEEFASFQYDKPSSVAASSNGESSKSEPSNGEPSSSESFKLNEPEPAQEPSDNVNVSYPIHHANENEAAVQEIQGTGEPAVSAGEIAAAYFATEASMSNQQGLMGIDQVIPDIFTPQNEMHNIASQASWMGNSMVGDPFELPQHFQELNNFDYLHGGMDQHAAFVPELPPHPFPDHYPHSSQLPFVPMDSVDPSTLSGFCLTENNGPMQAGPSNHGFNWSFDSDDSPPERDEESSFDDLMQQLTTV